MIPADGPGYGELVAEVERLRAHKTSVEGAMTEMNRLLVTSQDEVERLNELLRGVGANRYWEGRWRDESALNAEMLAALRLHKAWTDSETTGPDYGGPSRDTHPDGEKIWRKWWIGQLDLCERATAATDAAIAKAEGRS